MRPIVWGLILTVGAFFWFLFSLIFQSEFVLAGKEIPIYYKVLIYISGITMLFSLPISIAIEIYRWIKSKGKKRKSSLPPPPF